MAESFGVYPAAKALTPGSSSITNTRGIATPEASAISSTMLSRRRSRKFRVFGRISRPCIDFATAEPPCASWAVFTSVATPMIAAMAPTEPSRTCGFATTCAKASARNASAVPSAASARCWARSSESPNETTPWTAATRPATNTA